MADLMKDFRYYSEAEMTTLKSGLDEVQKQFAALWNVPGKKAKAEEEVYILKYRYFPSYDRKQICAFLDDGDQDLLLAYMRDVSAEFGIDAAEWTLERIEGALKEQLDKRLSTMERINDALYEDYDKNKYASWDDFYYLSSCDFWRYKYEAGRLRAVLETGFQAD